MAGLIVSLFYFVGVSLLVFHFANGLWTAAITWGLTVSEHAQKKWGYVCAGLGVGLMLASWGALAGTMMIDYDEAQAIEASLHGSHELPDEQLDLHTQSQEHTLQTAEVDPEG